MVSALEIGQKYSHFAFKCMLIFSWKNLNKYIFCFKTFEIKKIQKCLLDPNGVQFVPELNWCPSRAHYNNNDHDNPHPQRPRLHRGGVQLSRRPQVHPEQVLLRRLLQRLRRRFRRGRLFQYSRRARL
jgi:hypothetical protein